MDEIIKLLKLICKLLSSLDREEEPVRPARFARVYGPCQIIQLAVFVSLTPAYPDHEDYKPEQLVKGKAYRLKLAEIIEDEISTTLVGYKVEVRIENG